MKNLQHPQSLFTNEIQHKIESEVNNEYVSQIYYKLRNEYAKYYEVYSSYKTKLEEQPSNEKYREIYRDCVIYLLRIKKACDIFFGGCSHE